MEFRCAKFYVCTSSRLEGIKLTDRIMLHSIALKYVASEDETKHHCFILETNNTNSADPDSNEHDSAELAAPSKRMKQCRQYQRKK